MAAEKIKQHNAGDYEKLKSEEDSLRRQQVLDTRRAATPSRARQPDAEATRQRTNTDFDRLRGQIRGCQSTSSGNPRND